MQSSSQPPLPPVNLSSPLCAVQPNETSAASHSEPIEPPNFGTADLQHALMRSQQCNPSAGGLRRATSAPHSMNVLGEEGTGARPQQNPNYQAPSGGPMRRVASSLGMRRSSSFFWTPSAHRDFERAINTLSARGAEPTAAMILGEMSPLQTADLKLEDVDKHLRKRLLVQRRVLQQLGDPPSQSPTGVTGPGSFRGAGMLLPGGMAAVAEEPHCVPPAAAAAALSEGLARQLAAQSMQHMQMTAQREGMMKSVEAELGVPLA